ncbi:MAG: hypothetical protein U5P41_10705 [Gammaproteobacteria bacterium]|nr:hypothetical protein [Gammaproteobacteria bacterium]
MRSEVLLHVWDKFHEHNIEIPYPQRDLHLRSSTVNFADGSPGIPPDADSGTS